MELIERAGFLSLLKSKFDAIESEGHCILVSGEAGIGKTSLIRAFCKEQKDECNIYLGTCDALFTPRPLAPLYDIVWQMGSDLPNNSENLADRAGLFARILHELASQRRRTLIVFEDVHWADEATLDFIKFLARRITRIQCLFVLTYRDDEVNSFNQLRNVLGQLPPDSFTRMQLVPLSREAVEKMAEEKGYKGEDVYSISGGNPFYVNEILASYSLGVPENVKDSILSVYNRMDERSKQVWQVLSVLPTGLELKYLVQMDPAYATAIEPCLEARILLLQDGLVRFKHELYRRTIEVSLSPLLRVDLNKRILELFRENFEQNHETERIIHHAKNANEYDVVIQYAPLAAKQAAALGAHTEASKLYYTAIEYYQGSDKDKLLEFYEPYAYECYLTSRVKEAIVYQGKALRIWKERNDIEKMGNCMRFLSRLWWFSGNRKQAENYAFQAIEVLEDQPSSTVKAMAFSNLSQLKMMAHQAEECMAWGEKAIAIAKELGDEETLAHALNNIGTMQMKTLSSRQQGIDMLRQSLEIALRNSFHEHAARAYTNLGSVNVVLKNYAMAGEALETGIQYCEEKDLGSWMAYMLATKARMLLETGHWQEASRIAGNLLKNESLTSIVKIGALSVMARIKMRSGDANVLPLLMEAKEKAFDTMELQRIIPALAAFLEYEWLTGKVFIEDEAIGRTVEMIGQSGNMYETNEFAFWLLKARKQCMEVPEPFEGYQLQDPAAAARAVGIWGQMGCPYEQALALFEGGEEDKGKALTAVRKLGANAVYEKLKREMRTSGIRSIPRGIRKTTQSNPALLTERELGVLQLLKEGMQNKEIATRLFISAKTVDHHISAILFKLDVSSRLKAVQEAKHLGILK
ncbi:LuxR C-terminal-related transcriptional regulator [Flavitalea sp. BT771]|uniref:helix-turn-helix transcriptional regulator n=1 Tax=Flavitalea sp. BT771 TaxID=3063329 RepID=UPI0026E41C0C|nr:AAA family ATPase [Flavitalea sp. BT771]MDO6435149.1 LuxR C-terminal-related transcriptional regulator [Flavitalea sp. BT771]MDV6224146.1 LuxR C-terminal-related transcriptional regulator [Flavitalea sp. BT771]